MVARGVNFVCLLVNQPSTIGSSFSRDVDTTLHPLLLPSSWSILFIFVQCIVLNYLFIHLKPLRSSPPLQPSKPLSSPCLQAFPLPFFPHVKPFTSTTVQKALEICYQIITGNQLPAYNKDSFDGRLNCKHKPTRPNPSSGPTLYCVVKPAILLRSSPLRTRRLQAAGDSGSQELSPCSRLQLLRVWLKGSLALILY